MPRAAKKPEIDKDAVYVCWMAGSAEVDGETVGFHEGERLRGDSAAVQGCPQYFFADGLAPASGRPTGIRWRDRLCLGEAAGCSM